VGELAPTFWGRYERVLCTGGLSKAYCLPGLRTGWIVGQPETIDKLWQRIRQRVQRVLNENYAIMQSWLQQHTQHVRHIPPTAGGIAWIGYDFEWAAEQMAEELRRRKGVLIVPGLQFGPGFNDFIRIGFGGDPAHLKQGLERFGALLAETAALRAARAS
jgi:DNA-binding transcriptional MocR family regulator